MPDPHHHIWELQPIQGRWAYVIQRETYRSSEEAHRNRQGQEYIVIPCSGRHPACPKNG